MDDIKKFLKTRKVMNSIMVLANMMVFIVMDWTGNTENTAYMLAHGASFVPKILEGEYYRLFTSMFLHFGIGHFFNNMLVLVALGNILESRIGKVRYVIIYVIGGIAGNILSAFWEMQTGNYTVSAGASGAVFAVIGALLYIVLKNHHQEKAINLRGLFLMTTLMLLQGFTRQGIDNAAHIGGFAIGFLLAVPLCGRKLELTT